MIGFGQNVNIPDANFKAYLVMNPNINTNGDAEIQVSEATAFNGSISCNQFLAAYPMMLMQNIFPLNVQRLIVEIEFKKQITYKQAGWDINISAKKENKIN